MATRRDRKPRTFTPGRRQGLDHAAEHFLRECYRLKKPARAKDFARSLDRTPEHVSWLASQTVGGLHAFLPVAAVSKRGPPPDQPARTPAVPF